MRENIDEFLVIPQNFPNQVYPLAIANANVANVDLSNLIYQFVLDETGAIR